MRKKILLFLLIAITPLLLFAQEIVQPENWLDLYENYGVFFGTYLGVAGIATFIGEYVIRLLKLDSTLQKITVVVLLAIGFSFLGMAINIGYLAEATWWETIIWGGLSAATAAGLRSGNILFIKSIVDFVIGFLKSKE